MTECEKHVEILITIYTFKNYSKSQNHKIQNCKIHQKEWYEHDREKNQ